MKHLFTFLFFSLLALSANAQSVYVPMNSDYHYMIERYEVLSGKQQGIVHTSVRPYSRKDIVEFVDSLQIDSSSLSKADQFNYEYLQNDSHEWSMAESSTARKPILKYFYQKKPDFYHVRTKDLDLHVNPVLYFKYGKDIDQSSTPFINSRGVEVRGMINEKVGFYSFMTDNQAIFPEYVRNIYSHGKFNFRPTVPGEGFAKDFKVDGVDFITARGYFDFHLTKNIALQFGHDKNFIGNGYRSLILSDFSSSYTFLKLNTKVWKFNYMNLFTQMNAGVSAADILLPKKYVAFHHLSYNVSKNLNIGIFESVIFGREDSLQQGTFDINYLNPIIFYRSIEQQLGSKDNALLGMDYKWNFLKRFSLYGQLVLDEFLLKEIKAQNGWWANKQAFQAGLKYYNVAGIKNLDMQGEINFVRPYTYQHKSGYTNYSHYNQPIAHPLGANFVESIGIIRYQPIPRLNVTAKLIMAKVGLDTLGSNWGGNILLDYTTREQEYDNKVGQGATAALIYSSLNLSYQLKHNLFVDVTGTYRKLDSTVNTLDRDTKYISLSLRWNIPQRYQEF